MMRGRKHLVLFGVAATAAVATIAVVLPPRAPAPVSMTATAVAAPAAPATAPAAAAVPTITFPDGSQREVLNGVDEPVLLQWPDDLPYAPVVGSVRDGDTEWFAHGDGSWSTTLRRLDRVTGKYVTLAPVFTPGPLRPARLRGR